MLAAFTVTLIAVDVIATVQMESAAAVARITAITLFLMLVFFIVIAPFLFVLIVLRVDLLSVVLTVFFMVIISFMIVFCGLCFPLVCNQYIKPTFATSLHRQAAGPDFALRFFLI